MSCVFDDGDNVGSFLCHVDEISTGTVRKLYSIHKTLLHSERVMKINKRQLMRLQCDRIMMELYFKLNMIDIFSKILLEIFTLVYNSVVRIVIFCQTKLWTAKWLISTD